MALVGDAYDNAMAESFFATLKRELLSRRRFRSKAEARWRCLNGYKVGTTHAATHHSAAAHRPTTSEITSTG